MFRCRLSTLAVTQGTQQLRGIAFACQNPTIELTQNERGYKHDLWINIEDDKWWYSKTAQPKPGAESLAVQTFMNKGLEFYNEDQIESKLPQAATSVHSSVSTGMPYKGAMLKELAERALVNGYEGFWWATPNFVRKENLRLKPKMRPHVVLIKTKAQMLNVCEFTNPEELMKLCFSGDSAKPMFGAEIADTLKNAVLERKYATSVFFTSNALTDLNLPLKDGAQAVTSTSSEINTFYNLEDFLNQAALAKFLPADYTPDPTKPRYLTTGTPIAGTSVIQALTSTPYKETLWMSLKDLSFKQHHNPEAFALKPGSGGVSLPSYSAQWYNIEELHNPLDGKKKFGMKSR